MLRSSVSAGSRAGARPVYARVNLGGPLSIGLPVQPTVSLCVERRCSVAVRAQDDTARATAVAQATSSFEQGEGLLELDQDTFYPYLESQGDTLVVVDFYTDWCGPCKVIYPELVKLSKERPDIRIVKFNCNKRNKELGVKLGIKVAPTFHLYKKSTKVAEMTGAKIEKLIELIVTHTGGSAPSAS